MDNTTMTREEMRLEYRRLLLDWVKLVNELKMIASVIASDINEWIELAENTQKLEEVWQQIDLEVRKRYAVLNDAIWDWFKEQIDRDPDMPRWTPEDIVLNKEAFDAIQTENDLRDLATFNDIIANAKPYSKERLKSEKMVKKIKDAKKARKKQKSLSKK